MLSSSEEIITTSDESSLSFDHDDEREFSSAKYRFTKRENDRIHTLKILQISYNQLESQYFKSVNELEYKFHQQCSYLFEQRADIISGKYEPNDDECRLKTDFIETNERPSNTQLGIPSFWLQTLQQVPMIAEMIEEWDEPILKCLNDIKLRLQIQPVPGFALEFHFNEQSKTYFHNEILTKFYELQIEPEDELLFYEGTAIVRSEGCQIDWIDSKSNITRNHETNEFQSSFFHFFTSSTTISDDWKLASDFQIGHYIRENLLPKAILYYTGEIFDDEYDFSDDDDFSDEQEDLLIEQRGEGEH